MAVLDRDRITSLSKNRKTRKFLMAVPIIFFLKNAASDNPIGKGDNALDSPGSILAWLTGKVPVNAYEVRGFYHMWARRRITAPSKTHGNISPTDHIIL
jgi:hypothetical protein